MKTSTQLRHTLHALDGQSYKAYKRITGTYSCQSFPLQIAHVQADPFATPSRLRVQIPQSIAAYPPETHAHPSRNNALCTYLARQFSTAAHAGSRRNCGSGKSGLIDIDTPGQQVLERTCLFVDDEQVEARFTVGLPADGRRARGLDAAAMLCDDLPAIIAASLTYAANDPGDVRRYTESCEDADHLRAWLPAQELVAFVANGSILPRRSGIDDRPLENAMPFRSPPELEVTVTVPNRGPIAGMGIPAGVTLIVGGGFHGKSTLLNALERGIYNHIPGDGRELVVTDASAVKIRAEDGRSVAGVDISSFISDLPFGQDTIDFSTENASGSTSQAANIVEALELSSHLLLVDEDTAATNFMIRDARMRQLIQAEPITPFIDRVRPLFADCGTSTILVMGGTGDYFAVADTVIAMENYHPRQVTRQARALAAVDPPPAEVEPGIFETAPRIPDPDTFNPGTHTSRRRERIRVTGPKSLLVGRDPIDLSAIAQLIDASQTRALGAALLHLRRTLMDGRRSLAESVTHLMREIERYGLDALTDHPRGDLASFRPQELAAALNRHRPLRVIHGSH